MASDSLALPGWLHIDLKGAIPDETRLLEWIDRWAAMGYTGLVLEYEDRLNWATWPGTHRPGYDLSAWRRIWDRIAGHGMEIIPLIQTVGHLDWLFCHKPYEHLAESSLRQQACLTHPQALPCLKRWIDEVIDLHEGYGKGTLPGVHLGADEAWEIGSCPRCIAKARQLPHGKISLLLEHVRELCQHVIDRGVTPLIWADMFLPGDRTALLSQLPQQTILVEWQYRGAGPFVNADKLQATGRRVFGASGIRCNYVLPAAMAPLGCRIENVLGWRQEMERGRVSGLIHTTWGRPMSLSYLYGPWEGWLPAFIASADPQAWRRSPLSAFVERLDEALLSTDVTLPANVMQELDQLQALEPWEQQAVDWWKLALEYAWIRQQTVMVSIAYQGLQAVAEHRAMHWDQLLVCRKQRQELLRRIDQWEHDVRAFWKQARLSDEDEYIATRLLGMRQALEADWAAGIELPSLDPVVAEPAWD